MCIRDRAKQASRVMIITDSDKFSQKGVVNLIEIEKVACVYTDDNIPSKIEDYLNKRNIKVIKTE